MVCKINSTNPLPILLSSRIRNQQQPIPITIATKTQLPKTTRVDFKTLASCKLGISRYPDFEYNADGGSGTGTAVQVNEGDDSNSPEISLCFDLETLYIPPLTSETTRFLGLPMPPFLKIDIVPQLFQGSINRKSGKVDMEFTAEFVFSAGSIYRAPPLLVKTVLTSEEASGKMRSGRGERLDEEGRCRLIGVATVDPIDDFFMNSFLGLPTECLAVLNAIVSFSAS